MLSSDIALRRAILARLLGDSALVLRLGGARVHDEAPRGAPHPYVVFSQSRSRDWSTMTERGHEHALSLDVWSQGISCAVDVPVRIGSKLGRTESCGNSYGSELGCISSNPSRFQLCLGSSFCGVRSRISR